MYSIFVDDQPVYYWQGLIFISSLINLAGVSPDMIIVHVVGVNNDFEEKCNQLGIKIIKTCRWGDNKYCNKLQQTEYIDLQMADYVFLCDADIAIVENLDELASSDTILGKCVDYDNPNIEILEKIFKLADLPFPSRNLNTLNNKETFDGNFNGGLYGIPGKLLKQFGTEWKRYASFLLGSDEIRNLLDSKIIHIDQISFCMALKYLNINYKLLPIEYNFPTHIQSELTSLKLIYIPKVIHYHKQFEHVGILKTVGIEKVDQQIFRINQLIKNTFNNEFFWSFRCQVFRI